jgi:hypothetical protein
VLTRSCLFAGNSPSLDSTWRVSKEVFPDTWKLWERIRSLTSSNICMSCRRKQSTSSLGGVCLGRREPSPLLVKLVLSNISRFRVAEALAVIDWGESTGEDSDPGEVWDTQHSLKVKGSMKGLHVATTEGWLYQRTRERCTFVHDRFFQAAAHYRRSLPKTTQDKMSLRVILLVILWQSLTATRLPPCSFETVQLRS